MSERVQRRPSDFGDRLLYDYEQADKKTAYLRSKVLAAFSKLDPLDQEGISKAERLTHSLDRLSGFSARKFGEIDRFTSPKVEEEVLPGGVLGEEDVVVSVEDQRSLTQTGLVLKTQAEAVFANLIDRIPDPVLKDLALQLQGNVPSAQAEFKEIAELVLGSMEGKLTSPAKIEFLEVSTPQGRHEYVRRSLQAFIGKTLAIEIRHPVGRGLMWRMAREVNKLVYLCGSQSGRDIVCECVASLPAAQKILIYRAMSTELKTNLGYPDLEECDERQLGEYLKRTVRGAPRGRRYDRNNAEISYEVDDQQIERFVILLETILERHSEGKIQAGLVVDQLVESGVGNIFQLLIRAGQLGEQLDRLYELFQLHPATEVLAKRVFRMLRDGEEDETVTIDDLFEMRRR